MQCIWFSRDSTIHFKLQVWITYKGIEISIRFLIYTLYMRNSPDTIGIEYWLNTVAPKNDLGAYVKWDEVIPVFFLHGEQRLTRGIRQKSVV